jgi:hypothetical protein
VKKERRKEERKERKDGNRRRKGKEGRKEGMVRMSLFCVAVITATSTAV